MYYMWIFLFKKSRVSSTNGVKNASNCTDNMLSLKSENDTCTYDWKILNSLISQETLWPTSTALYINPQPFPTINHSRLELPNWGFFQWITLLILLPLLPPIEFFLRMKLIRQLPPDDPQKLPTNPNKTQARERKLTETRTRGEARSGPKSLARWCPPVWAPLESWFTSSFVKKPPSMW